VKTREEKKKKKKKKKRKKKEKKEGKKETKEDHHPHTSPKFQSCLFFGPDPTPFWLSKSLVGNFSKFAFHQQGVSMEDAGGGTLSVAVIKNLFYLLVFFFFFLKNLFCS
jgi:hypothetical protein